VVSGPPGGMAPRDPSAGVVVGCVELGSAALIAGPKAHNTTQQVLIDDGTAIYKARQRWEQHKLDLTINGVNSFAVEGKKLFLIDDENKTYEFCHHEEDPEGVKGP
jgi:hypothetical protein